MRIELLYLEVQRPIHLSTANGTALLNHLNPAPRTKPPAWLVSANRTYPSRRVAPAELSLETLAETSTKEHATGAASQLTMRRVLEFGVAIGAKHHDVA